MKALVTEAPAGMRAVWEMSYDRALQYQATIERFGRFPTRNAVLGRVSTEAELRFLAENVEKERAFAARWQPGQPPRLADADGALGEPGAPSPASSTST